jgi:hypothetical protein
MLLIARNLPCHRGERWRTDFLSHCRVNASGTQNSCRRMTVERVIGRQVSLCLALMTPPILLLTFSSSMAFPMMPSLLTLLALVNPTAASVGGGGGSSGAPWPAKVISWWYASGMNEVVRAGGATRAGSTCLQASSSSFTSLCSLRSQFSRPPAIGHANLGFSATNAVLARCGLQTHNCPSGHFTCGTLHHIDKPINPRTACSGHCTLHTVCSLHTMFARATRRAQRSHAHHVRARHTDRLHSIRTTTPHQAHKSHSRGSSRRSTSPRDCRWSPPSRPTVATTSRTPGQSS